MIEAPTSQELSLLENTVPSRSEHDFLLETINTLCNRDITEIQQEASARILQLEASILVESKKAKTFGQPNETLRTLKNELNKAHALQDSRIQGIQNSKEVYLQKLETWEAEKTIEEYHRTR